MHRITFLQYFILAVLTSSIFVPAFAEYRKSPNAVTKKTHTDLNPVVHRQVTIVRQINTMSPEDTSNGPPMVTTQTEKSVDQVSVSARSAYTLFDPPISTDELDPPVFVTVPLNETVELGVQNIKFVKWKISDANPDKYYILKNGSLYQGATVYTSNTIIQPYIDGSTRGTFNYTIVANDTFGNVASDTKYAFIVDTTAPSTVLQPQNLALSEGGSTILQWQFSDLDAANYSVTLDSQIQLQGNWSTNQYLNYTVPSTLALGDHAVVMRAQDASGNTATSTVTVTIQDATLPVITSSPTPQTVDYGPVGTSFNWTATDKNPTTYEIFRNATSIATGTWDNTTVMAFSTGGLDVGTYNFSIQIHDASSVIVEDWSLIDVADLSPPDLTSISPPSNLTITEDDQSFHSLVWTPLDYFPGLYNITRNGLIIAQNAPWISGYPITQVVDPALQFGVYKYILFIVDAYGNRANSSVFVTVNDVTVPSITSPGNLSYSIGTTGHSISWTATDAHPSSYLLYLNSQVWRQGSWSGGTITFSLDDLTLSTNNLTIFFTDQSGNSANDTVFVFLQDSPIVFSAPSDRQITNQTSGETISWVLTDSNPQWYNISVDGMMVVNGTWSNAIPITVGIDTNIVGTYVYTIWANDTTSKTVTDTVTITVTDVPQFVSVVYDPVMYEGPTGKNITFTSSDTSPATYIVYYNETGAMTRYDNGTWVSNQNYLINLDILLKGTYYFTIEIFDLDGNSNSTSAVITIDDTIYPMLDPAYSTPTSLQYNVSSVGNVINWKVIENNPDTYIIYLDNTTTTTIVRTSKYQNESIISVSIDGLNIGVYYYILSLNDTSGNVFNSTVTVTVIDVTDPVIVNDTDIIAVENAMDTTINWVVTDANLAYVLVYRNETSLVADVKLLNDTSYVSGDPFPFNVSDLSLPVGVYNFTVVAYDVSGNMAFASVIVEITDIPSITAVPTVLQFNETQTKFLNWTATDTKPGTYEVYWALNGSNTLHAYNNSIWKNGIPISINVTSFNAGTYLIMIVFDDLTGNTVNSSVVITVSDVLAPIATLEPGTVMDYNEGSSGNTLRWRLEDTNSYRYVLKVNGTEYSSGTWTSNVLLNISIDGLSLGYYQLNFTAVDTSGNPYSYTLDLNVNDISPPSISNPPDEQVVEGSSGNFLVWVSTEVHPGTYDLYQNDSKIIEGESWSSGVQIIIPIDGLAKGTYNFTIVVRDSSGNSNSDEMMITVVDLTKPDLLVFSPQSDTYVEGTSSNYLQMIAFDLYPQNLTLLLNDTTFYTNTWMKNKQQLIDINGLVWGTYNFTIYIQDESGNTYIESIIVNVMDQTSPEILSAPDPIVSLEENATDKQVTWQVLDLYPGSFSVLLNGSLYDLGQWSNSSAIVVDLSSLMLGRYLLLIQVFDQSNNNVSQEVTLVVTDDTPPQLVRSPGDLVVITTGTTGNTVGWQFYDTHPESYVVELDGEQYAQGSWSNNVTIRITLDGLVFGTYNLTIVVKDTSGNLYYGDVTIKVNDPAIIRTQEPTVVIRDQAKEGDIEYLSGKWLDENGTVIQSGEIRLLLRSSNILRLNYTFAFTGGQWSIYLNYTGQQPGIYTWEISFTKKGYETQTIQRMVEVVAHQVEIAFFFSDSSIVQGSSFYILVTVTYQNNTGKTTLLDQFSGFNVTSRSGGINDVELQVTIKYVHTNGDLQIIERSILSDENGRGLITLQPSITANIERLAGISAIFAGSTFLSSSQVSMDNLDISSLPPVPDQLEVFIQLSQEFLGWIILVLAIVGSALLYYRYYNKERVKRINKMLDQISDSHEEILSLMQMKAIILQNQGGIPIYIEESGQLGVDGVLISGFSRAISTFLDEIESSVITGFETIQRDTFAINSFSTSLGRIIFLSNDKLPDIMKTRMVEIMNFTERNYNRHLEAGMPLHGSDFKEIVNQTSFRYILLGKFTLNRRKIARAIKLKSLSRAVKENFKALLDYQTSNDSGEMTLTELYNYLRSLFIPATMVSHTISVGYSLDIYQAVKTED